MVYKRRVRTEYADAVKYLCQGEDTIEHSQIRRELDYTMQLYQGIRPAVYLSYEREAFYGRDDHELRITFDQNILWRTTQLDLSAPVYGRPLLEKDQARMEIKVGHGMPLWLVHYLTEHKIYRTSYSKYGNAYRTIVTEKNESKGELEHVS